jgi:hypothetical protein
MAHKKNVTADVRRLGVGSPGALSVWRNGLWRYRRDAAASLRVATGRGLEERAARPSSRDQGRIASFAALTLGSFSYPRFAGLKNLPRATQPAAFNIASSFALSV